jgi:hypothetical protein
LLQLSLHQGHQSSLGWEADPLHGGVCPDDEEEITESFEFLSKYKGYIDDIVYELKSFFDSIQVQLISGSKD